ncbi:MAG: phosphoribosylanthranilate isomerase [Acidimicrobiales bacterium]
MNDARPFVKVCGITSEADAFVCVGLGVDALGFIFAPSPRQMSTSSVADIVKRLPSEVLTVGVFKDEAPARVAEIANGIGLGAVQLHGHETPQDTAYVAERVACTIKAFSAGDPQVASFDRFGCELMLIDAESPGSGEVFDWRLAEGVVDHGRLIVSGGLHSGNVAQAIARLHPLGVDVATGVEASPGHKDPKKLSQFVSAVRAVAYQDAAHEEGTSPYDWLAER